jgi:hypothetical protein
VEVANMRKKDWLHLIAYGAVFLVSGLVLVNAFF